MLPRAKLEGKISCQGLTIHRGTFKTPCSPKIKSATVLLYLVRTKGYSTVLLDPTQVESKKSSQIQWPVPSINAEPVDIFLGEE